MPSLFLIVAIGAIASECSEQTIQEVLEERIKKLEEKIPEIDGLPLIVNYEAEDRQGARQNPSTSESSIPVQSKCSCNNEFESSSPAISSTDSKTIEVEPTTDEAKLKKFKVVTITLPEDAEAESSAIVNSESKSRSSEDSEQPIEKKIKEELVEATSEVSTGTQDKPEAKENLETVKHQKKNKKSKYGTNKRDKRDTRGDKVKDKKKSKNKRASEDDSKSDHKSKKKNSSKATDKSNKRKK